MSKLCPFRKETTYLTGRATGFGYPDMIEATEIFCECLKETCMMWDSYSEDERKAFNKEGRCKMEQ